MYDKIIIKNLQAQGILGIYPHERVQKQPILINIVMFTDIRPAAQTDSIHDAVSYETVSQRVIELVESSEAFLVEKLVTDIAYLILAEFSVARVQVRVEKPGILPYAESVGIEIERGQNTNNGAGA